ncbi:MAG TPA: 50S ribosomal protein L19 [Candidatus Megaira endosymbiont of Hartmannula sinica]|nr:50S ribosomal protein L19 [Candidatus Megaera endosymbiont of Hartmannula sinica]
MNCELIKEIENKEISKISQEKDIPEFRAGDTLRVSSKITDGNTQRIQNFEGVVIARSNSGINSSLTIRKISYGCGVERTFMIYSPLVSKIAVVKRGIVRRAKLFYLRNLSGKAARIKERKTR